MTTFENACVLYCTQNKRLQQLLPVIAAILEGATLREILDKRIAPNLSPVTITNLYSKYSKVIKNAK